MSISCVFVQCRWFFGHPFAAVPESCADERCPEPLKCTTYQRSAQHNVFQDLIPRMVLLEIWQHETHYSCTPNQLHLKSVVRKRIGASFQSQIGRKLNVLLVLKIRAVTLVASDLRHCWWLPYDRTVLTLLPGAPPPSPLPTTYTGTPLPSPRSPYPRHSPPPSAVRGWFPS